MAGTVSARPDAQRGDDGSPSQEMNVPSAIAMLALAVIDVLALVGILASPLLYFASIFLFDNPTPESLPLIYGMALALWSYPVTAGLGGVMGLRAYKARNLRRQLWWTLCAISSVLLIAVAVLLLNALCDGHFSCRGT